MIPYLLPVYKRFDFTVSHAKGMYVYSTDNQEYLDMSAGYAAVAFGHCPKELIDALTLQLNTVWHLSNKLHIPHLTEYCKDLCELTGFGKSAFIANSGAEAVECAIKMAKRYFTAKGETERYHFATLEGAFHGRTMGCISASGGSKLKGFEPGVPGFDARIKWNDVSSLRAAITQNTAAIIIEPIQGEGGMRALSQEFIDEMVKLRKETGMLIISDEVQCGMGRTGKMFGFEYFGFTPDILALGKGLGAGFPVSACIATEEVAKCMHLYSHGSTFGGNPLAVAVGRKVLELMQDPAFLPHVNSVGAYLKNKLITLKDRYPDVIDEITGAGLMLGIKLNAAYHCDEVASECLNHRLISTPASNNTLRFTPPLNITELHCDEAINKLEAAILATKSPISKVKRGVKAIASKLFGNKDE